MAQIARRGGFTLLELLVVMALLAIASAAFGPRLFGLLVPDPAKAAAEQIELRLNRARAEAIFKSTPQQVTLNFDDNLLTDPRGDWHPPETLRLAPAPPEDSNLPAVAPPSRIDLIYSPDGSAKADAFLLVNEQGQGWRFKVLPHTGRLIQQPYGTPAP